MCATDGKYFERLDGVCAAKNVRAIVVTEAESGFCTGMNMQKSCDAGPSGPKSEGRRPFTCASDRDHRRLPRLDYLTLHTLEGPPRSQDPPTRRDQQSAAGSVKPKDPAGRNRS